jgi:hypothetical protein
MAAPTDAEILGITLTDTPLDSQTELIGAAELFRALGIASSSWMRLEMHLDMVLLILNQPKHSEELYEKDHPIGFRNKIKLLKRWFNQHPELKPHSGEFRGLSSKILNLSKTRNIFLHSILSSFDPVTKEAVWRSIKPVSESTYAVNRHAGSIETLIIFAAEVNKTHFELAAKVTTKVFAPGAIARLQTP